jgi:RNA polymerase sigma factor (sigma-70 family)
MGEKGVKYGNIHKELIERCKAGERDAQFEIYGLYYKSMYNTCLRIVNDASVAEDLMQESFLSAFSKINTYRGTVSFGAWLKRIVVNRSIDYIRKKKLNILELNNHHSDIRDEDLADDFEYSEDLIKKVKQALAILPEGYRIVLSLNILEGYNHSEVGQILGISESTSRSQLARAKKKIIGIIKKQLS